MARSLVSNLSDMNRYSGVEKYIYSGLSNILECSYQSCSNGEKRTRLARETNIPMIMIVMILIIILSQAIMVK